jgi:hypothetical protein
MLLAWIFFLSPLFLLQGGKKGEGINPSTIILAMANPSLTGPENLCIVFGGVIGTYSAGGNTSSDVYTWKVAGPQGEEVFNRTGGSQFETIKVSFNEIGIYKLSLSVRRNTSIIYTEKKDITVQKGPELALLPDYLLCGEEPTLIQAIDPATPEFNQFEFIWRDIGNNIVGRSNDLEVNKEGFYKIELFKRGSSGQQFCTILGSSYVGPSLDYKMTLSSSSICQGGSVVVGIDTPLAGEWFLQSPGESQYQKFESSFSLELKPENLSKIGDYTVKFSAIDPAYPDCRSERKISFEVRESPKIDISLLQKPDNCIEENGSFSIKALSSLDSIRVFETGQLFTNISPGQIQTLTTLKPQIYSIAAYSDGCEFITLFNLETKDPPVVNAGTPDINIPEYIIEPEKCSQSGVESGFIKLNFNQGNVNGEFRILSLGIGEVITGQITNENQLTIPLMAGNYIIELKIDGCTYPIKEFSISKIQEVSFSIPKEITICQTFNLKPETSQDLSFRLKLPDGSEQSSNPGDSFTVTQEGIYELIASPSNPSSGLCPKSQLFTAKLASAFSFDLSLFEEDCFGNQVYQAVIEGLLPEHTSIRWINSEGEIVGRNEFFFSTAIGDYSLIVQPLQSGFCPKNPIFFTVKVPVLQVDVNMEANKICPEPGTSQISVSTNMEELKTSEWIFFNDSGERKALPEFNNQLEITVEKEGNYEIVVYNRIGCEIGRNFIKVEKSQLLTLPILEDEYGVCSKVKSGPSIDPGDFDQYFWYLDEVLVSEDPVFNPKETGEYLLKVITKDRCEFYKSFSTYDACAFSYVMPNALVLGDPSRIFEVTLSKGITDIELFIYNRQGELIHHEKSEEIPIEVPFLQWEGRFQGKLIPIGTYAVVLFIKNSEYNYREKITSSLLVIQ